MGHVPGYYENDHARDQVLDEIKARGWPFKLVDDLVLMHEITEIRHDGTTIGEFTRRADIIGEILMHNVTFTPEEVRRFTKESTVLTPIGKYHGRTFNDVQFILVPILRAGLSFLTPARRRFRKAVVGLMGQRRDEETAVASPTYANLPLIKPNHIAIVLDPMLATGGSACNVLAKLKAHGVKNIKLVTAISAPDGVWKVHTEHPDVPIITAALDDHLDRNAFIVPGCGDWGNRWCGSE